jgi:hypothetical protein
MKYFLLAAYLFVTYSSIRVMYQLLSDIDTSFDFLQVGALCTVWTVLLIVAGNFIYSCLKQKL